MRSMGAMVALVGASAVVTLEAVQWAFEVGWLRDQHDLRIVQGALALGVLLWSVHGLVVWAEVWVDQRRSRESAQRLLAQQQQAERRTAAESALRRA